MPAKSTHWNSALALGLFALLVAPHLFAARESSWLEIRDLEQGPLENLVDSTANSDENRRLQALLTLADRGLNQSVALAARYFEQAQPLIFPGTDEAYFSLAVGCQLKHRQALDGASAACGTLIEPGIETDNRLVQAYVHSTLAYYYYREGKHDQSLAHAYSTLESAQGLKDHGLLATGHNLVGLYFSSRLLPRLSMPHLESAWQHAGQMRYPEFKVVVQLNLASNYTYFGRGQEALQMLREVEDLPVVSLYPTRRLVLQSMLAQARVTIGDLDGAEEQLAAAMAEVSDKILPDGMTFALTGLGRVQLAKGRHEDALATFGRVLEIVGLDFTSGLDHPRIQLVVVPYAQALREAGQFAASRQLLQLVVDNTSTDEPDQLLVDAYRELSQTLEASGDRLKALEARETSFQYAKKLWDASFQYQYAQLNASMESDRRKVELELANERERALTERAEREKTLRMQSWVIGAMFVAVVLLFQSRRMQKSVADSQRAASEGLEELVQTRTQELEDEMAQRLRAEVDRHSLMEQLSEKEKLHALGQLTAGVAHDFNNLMTVVSLSADHLKSGYVSADAKSTDDTHSELLDNILSAADTGSKITNGLLAYVRKQPLQPKLVQLDRLLNDSLALFRNTLGDRFEFTSRLQPCQVRVDEGQLITSILNLILNAKEAIDGRGVIELMLGTSGGNAEISIRDSGSGMTEETRRRAFEPFYSTKDVGEGTGLGLSMVYGFACQSGGDLLIESAESQGTIVTLALPLAAADVQDVKLSRTPRQSALPLGLKVLVVEDRELLRQMLDRTLTQLGMAVSVAGSAEDALTLVDTQGMPDLLVSDIVMPGGMDGSQLAERLRLQGPKLAVLLISGYADSVNDSCRFLRKPFSLAELEHAVRAALSDVDFQQPSPGVH